MDEENVIHIRKPHSVEPSPSPRAPHIYLPLELVTQLCTELQQYADDIGLPLDVAWPTAQQFLDEVRRTAG